MCLAFNETIMFFLCTFSKNFEFVKPRLAVKDRYQVGEVSGIVGMEVVSGSV